ncbi:porphobilinogen synthase [Legionella sp. D16C41]|uniref:porphobilinogen synthase n=1 Tax=Legionella sp. D16C41 TaxID=3402688 RepID=UPI003AF6AA58
MNYTLPLRLKRLRATSSVRALVQETRLHPQQFIAPIFIDETTDVKQEITTMPGQFRLPLSSLPQEIEEISKLNIPAVLLFGIPKHKDPTGSASIQSTGIIQRAIQNIKETNPNLVVITDVCFCEYTSHGHCGALAGELIDNDATLALLAEQAVSHAQAGADWVAPSSMTDGMVGAIRQALDKSGFQQTAILSYAVKYCSCFYGPFGKAADGAPQFGDRKTYQMDPANSNEAIREAALDLKEGADMLMVKPAMNYLDIIYKVKNHFPEVPLGAYQVSGEYAMLKYAAQQGLIDEKRAITESLLAIKRAGADLIISYFAKDIARLLKEEA